MFKRENKKEKSFIQRNSISFKNKSKDNKFISQKNIYKDNFRNSTKKNNIRINLLKKEKEKEKDSELKKYNKITNKKKFISDKKPINKHGFEGQSKNKSFQKNRQKKINKNENVKPFNIEDSNEKIKNNLFNNNKRRLTKNSFSDFMTIINNELNIPGRNNKLSITKLFSLPLFNNRRKSYILNSLEEDPDEYKNDAFLRDYNKQFEKINYKKIMEKNEKFEKIKKEIIENNYKTISYFDLKESSRLILLRPILKYTLYQDHEKSNLSNITNKLFRVPNKLKLTLNLTSSTNSLKSNNNNKTSSFNSSEKSEISENSDEYNTKDLKGSTKKQTKRFLIKDDNAYVKRKIYKNITEKYSEQYLRKKYYKDDNDLLNYKSIRIYKWL